jgi:hypothetical protein
MTDTTYMYPNIYNSVLIKDLDMKNCFYKHGILQAILLLLLVSAVLYSLPKKTENNGIAH